MSGTKDEESTIIEAETEGTSDSEDTESGDAEEVLGTAYMYAIPLEEDEGTKVPSYDPHIEGGLFLYHYGPNYLYVIQGSAAGHFHRDNVNVMVKELDGEEVQQSDNRVRDFV